MKSLLKEMDKVEVESYKDCVWYIKDEDKCKMPGIGVSISECFCKDKEMMDEFCVWLTKFFKACPTDDDDVGFECDFNKRPKEESYFDIVGRFVEDIRKKICKQ